jgi:predicted lysophospholipase L1 biosynthesis ABC-type transport system permease subunit
MRKAVIVAAAGCVMFVVALISGSVWAAVGVIVLALAGLLLLARDLRRDVQNEEAADIAPVLRPENFAPDITDGDSDDVTESVAEADEYGDDDYPFGEPLPAPADDDTRIA